MLIKGYQSVTLSEIFFNQLFIIGNKDVYPEDEFLDIPHDQHDQTDQYDVKPVQQTIESDVL